MSRFDPREWTIQRLTFSATRLLGQGVLLRGRKPRVEGYEEAVLVRKPGRNAFEVFFVLGIFAALYTSAVFALIVAAGANPTVTAVLLPLLPFATLAVSLGAIIIGGIVGFIAERLPFPVDRLRASEFTHLSIATLTAAALALNDHWTRWVGVAWFALSALNVLCMVFILLFRPWFRRTSEKAWRDTRYVD